MALENLLNKTINKAKKSLKSLAYAGLVGVALMGGGGVREAGGDIIRPSSYSGDIVNPLFAYDNGIGDTSTYAWIRSVDGWKYGYYDFILPPIHLDEILHTVYESDSEEMGIGEIDLYNFKNHAWENLISAGISDLTYFSFPLNSDFINSDNLVSLRGGAWGYQPEYGGVFSAERLGLYDLYIEFIPEPATMGLIGVGLASLLALSNINHKRKKK